MWAVCTNLVDAITYPTFKISSVGEMTAPQQMLTTECSSTSSSLGQVFTSNVFGHYILTHFLVPLLSASRDQGRMIFVSSIEALPSHLDPIDIQALNSDKAYESSKRLTDVLALTSSLPSTKPFVERFLSGSSSSTSQTTNLLDNEPGDPNADTRASGISLTDNEYRAPASSSPEIYICHPGICATSIVPLPLILYYCMIAAFYIARWIGSPWHTVSAYKGACAPVWLALADKEELEDMEQTEGKGKWGSSCDRSGHERVMRTVVGGWGLGGKMGEPEMANRKGTRPGTREVTKEDRERFEELGRECWRQMEALRMKWEARIKSE
jgi:3-keto steroid reductase